LAAQRHCGQALRVHDASDEQSAIEKAIEEYKVQASQRGRPIAQRRD
jgi:hypothetical protein